MLNWQLEDSHEWVFCTLEKIESAKLTSDEGRERRKTAEHFVTRENARNFVHSFARLDSGLRRIPRWNNKIHTE